ncbi:MAG: hypothetical protein HKN77_06810 [Woeseiaceae bacterium]|nr:hypothetical protein [Woeseiaceae bacterium]
MKINKTIYGAIIATVLFGFSVSGSAKEATAPLDAILGVTVGMAETKARDILTPLGETAGRDTRSGGRKQGFILKDSRYAWVAYKAGKSGNLKWVSANLRPGEEVAFGELGDLDLADSVNDYQVIWNVARGDTGYRLVAKGQNGKASIVYLLALD